VPDSDAVAAALARLVTGSAPSEASPPIHTGNEPSAPDRVVADAEAALTDLPSAAAFVDEGGEQRLHRAIEESDDDRIEERGRAVLAALERLRTAAEPSGTDDTVEGSPPRRDHFHRGRTTLLKGDGVATGR
jgi:hypothetical protein